MKIQYEPFTCKNSSTIGLTLTNGTPQEWDLLHQYVAKFDDSQCMIVTSLQDKQRKYLYIREGQFNSIISKIFLEANLDLAEIKRQLFILSL